jgi:UDP:flavonoid glycosyltransferase YjiC (YdhE family)
LGVKKILVAPLNWGLGHATRCIPIIDKLIDLGHEVFLASDGLSGILLQQEYPSASYIELPSYHISYPERNFYWHWLKKAPRLSRAIDNEHQLLRHLVRTHAFDMIISDNRYGLYHPDVRSVILTHQINLPLPGAIAPFLNRLIRSLINRFDECWIPDVAPPNNLSGFLSQGDLSIPLRYLGILSRMQKRPLPIKHQVAVILSGPEPLRTQLQKQIENKLSVPNRDVVMVLGTLDNWQSKIIGRTKIFTHLSSRDLNQLLNESDIVISRPGYSSLMDYFTLNKKAILIPTPNQPEQAYLAERHRTRPEFYIPKSDLADLDYGIQLLDAIQPNLPALASLSSLPI